MSFRHLFFLCTIFFISFFILGNAAAGAVEKKSQCIQCHTNLKKLIRLCWEVEKLKPALKGSSETSGEG